ncbi:MAG: cbb3-type cytochrome c oxidase N-terminal domain-containing protein [Verrucomicrobiota bacterium]
MKPKPNQETVVTLREHVFDGIQEYDQKLPNWWLFTLYIMIVWFVIAWVIYYQLPLGYPNDFEKLEAKIAVIDAKKAEELEQLMASLDNDAFAKMALNSEYTAPGKAIFEAKCAACHGMDLSGTMAGVKLPGVPLNDKEWLYGGTPLDIWKIVREGSPDVTKGMIAWNTQLTGQEIVEVVTYVLSQQP